MVPFKQIFLGNEARPYRRAVNSQKCLRISGKHNDLEQVGRDTYHHTFFEMLGNWSFGDYYKREAIEWAWELLTGVWKLPKDKLYATVYTTDDEAAALWAERTDVGRDRILRFEAENFWEMGETGPCGPCSEIHIDRGPGACDRRGDEAHRCAVNGRAVTFLVADGILPSNEGRGYVLRRLLRRAARHGKLLGLDRPFLHEVVGAVVQAMGRAYPEVVQQHRRIAEVVRGEEERFAATLDRGLALLAGEVEKARAAKARVLSGEVAFRLYDTYGFPLDLTEDILAGEGLAVDKDGFERAMEAQRLRGRGAQRFADAEAAPEMIAGGALASRFVGDRIVEWESEVLALLVDGQATRGPVCAGTAVDVVTAETPFYAESGGQVGDRGWLETAAGAKVEVTDTQKLAPTVVAHRGVVREGPPA